MVVSSLELGLFFSLILFVWFCLFIFVIVIELRLDGCVGVEKAGEPS